MPAQQREQRHATGKLWPRGSRRYDVLLRHSAGVLQVRRYPYPNLQSTRRRRIVEARFGRSPNLADNGVSVRIRRGPSRPRGGPRVNINRTRSTGRRPSVRPKDVDNRATVHRKDITISRRTDFGLMKVCVCRICLHKRHHFRTSPCTVGRSGLSGLCAKVKASAFAIAIKRASLAKRNAAASRRFVFARGSCAPLTVAFGRDYNSSLIMSFQTKRCQQ